MQKEFSVTSDFLKRSVEVSTILAESAIESTEALPLLLLHDGQDFPALKMQETVNTLVEKSLIPPVMVVGVHANRDRKREYGVASQPDYAGRGDKAFHHTHFILEELLPHLARQMPISDDPGKRVIAGCSLGGLMALDIAWNHSGVFGKTGIFSGALWWRQKGLDGGYQDSDRIMHKQIRLTHERPRLQCWFQTGTQDETDDRDHDGIIDSIADTLDCIAALERKGFRWGKDLHYEEVKHGKHHPDTWSAVMPAFLKWAFSN